MARGGIPDCGNTSNICSQCGKDIEILNNDVEFSMELHKQSHKSLDIISQEFERQLGKAELRTIEINENSKLMCLDCNEIIEILNNDVTLSLQLHTQNHKCNDSKSSRQDHLSNCSSNISPKSNKMQVKEKPQPLQISILDEILNALAPDLVYHRDFIFENSKGKASCNVCNMTIEPVFSIPEHLKTKMHEDNIITFLKEALPANLHQLMEFVSFYGQNLSCKLCSCNIDLCSKNPHETIVNIMAHNNDKDHLNRLSNSRNPDKSLTLLNSLSQISPIIEENKKFIAFKMKPNFECNLCDKQIAYDDNENVLLKNFTTHLNGANHNKWQQVMSVFDLVKIALTKKQKKQLVIFQNSIFCKICECHIEVNYDQIMSHVKERCKNISATPDPNIAVPTPVSCSETNNSELITENLSSVTVKQFDISDLNKLLANLPDHLKNTTCLTVNEQGKVVCLVCMCEIPANTHNIETHLMGKVHKKSECTSAHSISVGNNTVLSETLNGKHNVVDHDKVYKLLVETDPLIISNSKVLQKDKDGNYYTCILCNVQIKVSSSLHDLQQNVHFHLESFEHTYNLEFKNNREICKDESFFVEKLLKLLPFDFIDNLKYVRECAGETKMLMCSMCDLKISTHLNCLQEHFEGSSHIKKLKNLWMKKQDEIVLNLHVNALKNIVINDAFIKSAIKNFIAKDGAIFCNLCKCSVTICNNKKLFRDILLSHVVEDEHQAMNKLVTLLETLYKLQISTPIVRCNKVYLQIQKEGIYCTLCLCTIYSITEQKYLHEVLVSHLSGGIHCSKRENIMKESSSTSIEQEIIIISNESIRDLFKRLPANVQDNISYVKCSGGGFVTCTLCSSLIDPLLLKEHLEGEKHMIKKPLNTLPYNLNVTKGETDKKESIQNKSSLQKLLGNIENKVCWP